MKRYISHLLVSVLTFAISLAGMATFFYYSSKNEKTETPAAPVENKIEARQNSTSDEPPRPTEPKSLSPYDIQEFIHDNPQADTGSVWRKLNIHGKFNGLPNWEKDENFLEICNRCEAETFKYNLDDEPGSEVLLRISNYSQEASRYLIFKFDDSQEDSWKLLGFIDHDFGRYRMPEHYFLLSGGKSFLVVQVQTQSGSGVSHYTDRLFTVQKGKLVELLSYSAEGFESNFAARINQKFSGRVSDCRIISGTVRIEVEYAANYYSFWDEKTDFLLWSKKQKVVYIKPLNSKRAKLDSSKSEASQKEIETIYNILSSNDEDILKYNIEELKIIAREKGKRNQWLRRFLADCRNSKEKSILRAIIFGESPVNS